MKKLLPLVGLLLMAGCSNDRPNNFQSEVKDLKEYFHIPGLAVVVKQGDKILFEDYMGLADVENNIPMDSTTTVPIASVTKMFAGALLRNSPGVLDRPINEYVEGTGVGDSILVRHVLTHTSQGNVGKHFYYSNRYAWLGKVIEKESGKTFEEAINGSIKGLGNTYLLKDSLHGRKIAKGYFFNGETTPGFIDYGYSASAGISTTVRDLAKFGRQFNDIGGMQGLYGYGLFSQEIEGEKILWSYGQYDCHSTLFIRIPGKDITLAMTANNNLMSDPARLIYGDVRSSLFALSFFRNFLNIELPREQLRAKAVAQSFFARYDSSIVTLQKLFKEYPNYKTYGDLTLLHSMADITSGEFNEQKRSIGAKLLKEDPTNPYANIYMAWYYIEDTDSANYYYSRIAGLKNFSTNWYTREAQGWLKDHP